MPKEYNFKFCSSIPKLLLEGDTFDRYDDETCTLDIGCFVKFEESGFYIVWEPKSKDAGLLDISQIWEARQSGTIKDAKIIFDLEQRPTKESVEDRTIWITYGWDIVTVNSLFLIAKSAQIAKDWRDGINSIVHNYKLRHACPTTALQKHWRSLCLATNDRGKIPLRNIIKTFSSGKPERMVHKCLTDLGLAGDKFIVRRLNGKWSKRVSNVYKCRSGRKRAKKEREELDVSLFTFEKFLRLYHKICPRTDVQELFVKLSGQKEYLTRDKLITFLNDEQRDLRLNEILFPYFDNARADKLIAKYETDESYIAQGKMSGDGFLRFLMSDENSPVFLDRTERYQDMDQPLCHYYINSSHNTYLSGRQYGGKSSTEIYRQVLLSGCRCVELDAWDRENEPIITHGKAMCTDVSFKEVLYQIRDTAFLRTDFPVILSFENHCSKSNQLKMAKYCMEVFGDMLLTKPLDDFPLEPGVPLPSPNRLRRKILIKNKRLKLEVERHQLDQFIREGRLDEDDDFLETPEVVGEDAVVVHMEHHHLQQHRGSPHQHLVDEMMLIGTSDDEYESSQSQQNQHHRNNSGHGGGGGGQAQSPSTTTSGIVSQSYSGSGIASSGGVFSSSWFSSGRLTPSSSRSLQGGGGGGGSGGGGGGSSSRNSSRNSSPRNSIDSRSLLLAAFDSRRQKFAKEHSLKASQDLGTPTTTTSGGGGGIGIPQSSSIIAGMDRSNSSKSIGRSPRFPFRSMTSSVKSNSTSSPPTSSRPPTAQAGDQRAHPEMDPPSVSQTPPPLGPDLKDPDEVHAEIKTNLISKFKPLSFAKKPALTPAASVTMDQQQEILQNPDIIEDPNMLLIGRDKRSFRRPSGTPADHSISAALLDATPKRMASTRQKQGKKPLLTKEEEEKIFAEYNYTGATTNIHPLLSAMVNYTHPVKFAGFDVAEMNDLHFHMSSFSESTGLGYLKQSAPEFVNYNKRQLSRIYPKGARVDSSNFLPQIFWNAGCQMVSLNFQTPDVYMQLNQGKFDYNGMCGYLLKPDFMRRPDRTFDPFSESPVDGVIAAHCSVRVISGQFLSERKVGTYAEVEMYGLPTDTIRKEHRTKTVPGNGLNPIYNEEPFVFRKVVLPELAVLRFAVYDENNKQLGQRILPLDGLQAGYRHISLRTESTMPMTLPTLFVHLVLKTYVPDELSGLVDALADPRAYLSAQEKRKEALHNMGVDDSDIIEVQEQTEKGTATGTTGSGPIHGAIAKKAREEAAKQKANGTLSNERQNNVATPTQEYKDNQMASTSSKPATDGFENRFKRTARLTASLRLGFTAARNRHKKLPKIDISTPEFDEQQLHQKHSTSSLSPTTMSKLVLSPDSNNPRKKSGLAEVSRKSSATSQTSKKGSTAAASDQAKTQFCKIATEVALPSTSSASLRPVGNQKPRLSINATLALEDTKREWTKRLSHDITPASIATVVAQQPKKFQLDPITILALRKEKIFHKTAKKLKKDMEELNKRHQKQRDAIQKQQQSNVDKLIVDSQKMSKKRNNLTSRESTGSRHSSLGGRASDPASSTVSDMCNDHKIRSLVSNQTDEWSTLIRRQENELFEIKKQQITDEYDLLKKLLLDAQKTQMDTLRTKLEVETRELKQSQTRKSMEDTRQIENDRSIASRAEKERRVKETKERNLKLFVEERKRLAMKAEIHQEQLTKRHAEQVDTLEREKAKVLEQEDMNHRESILASKPESVV